MTYLKNKNLHLMNYVTIGDSKRKPTANRRLTQWWVTWLIKHSTSHPSRKLSGWCIDSFNFPCEGAEKPDAAYSKGP